MHDIWRPIAPSPDMYHRNSTAERQPISSEKARHHDTAHDSKPRRYRESISFFFYSRRRGHETRSSRCTTLKLCAQRRYRIMRLNSLEKPT